MQSSKKQIVLIMVDTQRREWTDLYAGGRSNTPHLRRFGEQGAVFERAYCTQAVCSPARSSIFTGSYPHTNGMMGNEMQLYNNIKSVGERLTDAGICAGYVGKWHLDGGDYFGSGTAAPGWDPSYWYDMRMYLDELSPEERRRSREWSSVDEPWFTREFTYAHRTSARAERFIRDHRDEDYLLVVSFDEPHGPSLCPREYYEPFQDYAPPVTPNMNYDMDQKPLAQRLWADDPKLGFPAELSDDERAERIAPPVRKYLACSSFVDTLIGELLQAIDQYADDPMVIYTADHADLAGAHRLRGKGSAMYEENYGVPFAVRWPGVVEPGRRSAEPISHIDITATILDFFDIERTSYIEGQSLIPMLRDPTAHRAGPVFLEFNRFQITRDTFGGFQPARGVTDGRYKLVINLMETDELYDLETDPYEMSNLIASPQHQSIRDQLHDQIVEWMNETLDPFRGYQVRCRPWRTDAVPSWKETGLARQRWDEVYEEPSINFGTAERMTERIYSQYPE